MLLLTVCLTTNCYSGPGGDMYPQVGEGYTVVKTTDDRDAAQILFGETTIQIVGSWAEKRIDNTYTIENNSAVPFGLDFAQIKVEVQREETAKTTIISITDLSNYNTQAFDDAKNAKKIYQEYYDSDKGKTVVGTTKVSCAPKKKCIFSINAVSSTKMNRNKAVKITLPATSSVTKETVVFFNLHRNSIWDSLTAKIN